MSGESYFEPVSWECPYPSIADIEVWLAKNREEAKKHKRERQEQEHRSMSKGLAHQIPLVNGKPKEEEKP